MTTATESKTQHFAAMAVATAEVREEVFEGRTYLVAPVVALQSGVLQDGTLIRPEALTSLDANAWSDIPLPISHPRKNGEDVTAKTQDVITQSVIGRLYNTRYVNHSGVVKLHGELWVDIDKAAEVGGAGVEVLQRLKNGEPLEVSTAYLCFRRDVAGVYEGVPYTGEEMGFVPDHLALLPFEIGNCSVAMGCGAPRVNVKGDAVKLRDGETLCQREAALLAAARKTFGTDSITLNELADETADVAVEMGGFTGRFGIEYKTNDSGTIELVDNPKLLEQKREPDMAKTEDRVQDATWLKRVAQKARDLVRLLGVNEMTREEMLAKLKTSGATDELVADLSDAQLKFMLSMMVDEPEVAPYEPPTPDVATGDEPVATTTTATTSPDSVEATATGEAVEEPEPALVGNKLQLGDVAIDAVTLRKLNALVLEADARKKTEKGQLVAALVANSACSMQKATLESMEVPALQELLANFAPADYAGMGLPRASTNAPKVNRAPAILKQDPKAGE